MTSTQTGENMTTENNLAALEAVLDDLDLDEIVEPTGDEGAEDVVEEASADEVTEIDDALEEAMEREIDRAEAYESMTATPVVEDPANAVATSAAPTKKSRAASAKPRAARDLNSLPDEVFILEGDTSSASPAVKADTISRRPTQVKVADKFDNLFASLATGTKPSVYVVMAFNLLDEKNVITSADLIGAYKAAGLGEGTARSQTGQIMNLFSAVKIAARSGNTLTLNENSAIAAKLRSVLSASSSS